MKFRLSLGLGKHSSNSRVRTEMGNRILPLATETIYHVFNRGCNKQNIFLQRRDYEVFLEKISKYQTRFKGIKIISYCLLPNHFHFLLIDTDSSNWKGLDHYLSLEVVQSELQAPCHISSFMQKLQQSHAAYFNAKYGKTIKAGKKGPIFEGRFKAKEVTSEDYLAQLQVYIEHNAVKHELVDRAEDWLWSSYDFSGFSSNSRVRTVDELNNIFE